MNSVLVLNADYSPLTLCTIERAFLLVYLKKAELISDIKEKSLRTIDHRYPFPSVIKIKNYVHVPYKGVVLSRHNIFKRDDFCCQYCGTGKDLTLDHLIPKSKGGKSSWTNLVTACKRCNTRKGDFKPEDVGLQLSKKPIRPSYVMFLKSSAKSIRKDWMPFLEHKVSA
ncbi:HNH endonuclease [Marinoscillum furvescens]|uniref:5-methylcytosine-specific restriction endonuclease McrA n=1 Tax=Marinoscillum furvescens DSM 4134 TaxID=1122208 RepID=A0A3D9LJ81_MARFU|nr:HNH endonuclease [Marinoscillum furvescens]REE05716.1 5-methylcytosine-specific restriction endonuclease McrA [Marinoscillum furvescens DSM 4134]